MTSLTESYLATRVFKCYPLIWDSPQINPLCVCVYGGILTSTHFSDALHRATNQKEASASQLLYLLSSLGVYEATLFITRHCLPLSLSFSQWSFPEVT